MTDVELWRSSKEKWARFPQSGSCVKREQRSERGSHVGAETSQLQERNAEEKKESRSFSFGGHVVLLVSRVREANTEQFSLRKLVCRWKERGPMNTPGPFFTVQSNLSSRRRRLKQTSFSCQQLWRNRARNRAPRRLTSLPPPEDESKKRRNVWETRWMLKATLTSDTFLVFFFFKKDKGESSDVNVGRGSQGYAWSDVKM